MHSIAFNQCNTDDSSTGMQPYGGWRRTIHRRCFRVLTLWSDLLTLTRAWHVVDHSSFRATATDGSAAFEAAVLDLPSRSDRTGDSFPALGAAV